MFNKTDDTTIWTVTALVISLASLAIAVVASTDAYNLRKAVREVLGQYCPHVSEPITLTDNRGFTTTFWNTSPCRFDGDDEPCVCGRRDGTETQP